MEKHLNALNLIRNSLTLLISILGSIVPLPDCKSTSLLYYFILITSFTFGIFQNNLVEAQVYPSFNFNETETEVTIIARGNNTDYPVITGTIRYTADKYEAYPQAYENGRLFALLSKTTKYGTWNLPNGGTCFSGASYKCATITFTPNDSTINSLPKGTRAELWVNFFQPGSNIEVVAKIYIQRDKRIVWLPGSDGNGANTNPSNTETFQTESAEVITTSDARDEFSFKSELLDGSSDSEIFPLTKSEFYSEWPGEEWHYSTPYAEWIVGYTNQCQSNDSSTTCFRILFRPIQSAMNLVFGRNIVFNLHIITNAGKVDEEIYKLRYKFLGHPETTLMWDNDGSETITTGNILKFNEIFGTASIFKKKVNAISFDTTERLNQSSQSFEADEGDSVTLGNLTVLPIGINFKYGNWFVEEIFSGDDDLHDRNFHSGSLRFLFRPNTAEINSILNTEESITSSLNFHIHQQSESTPKINTTTIAVTINRSSVKPIISISSKSSSVIEGQSATFTITSNVDPMQPFLVSYIPTNSKGNFLDLTTFPTSLSQLTTLTFTQAEDSDNWTDEIEINLRDVDGIDTENGSITVTLDTTSEKAFYFAAAEPDNAATIIVEDAEKPTLSFAENSYSFTEEDVDKDVELILNLSESIDDAVIVSYVIVEDTATAGNDFIDINNGSVSILPNTASIPINIQIKGDELSEGNEEFKVVVTTTPSNAYIRHGVSTLEARVTIVDDEPIIMSITITDYEIAEDVVNGNFIVEVELTKSALIANPNTPLLESVSFLVETSSGTATIDADFKTPDRQPTQPRFRIPVDAKTFSFAVPILNDVKNEGNETFNLRIHDLQQATFADGTREQPIKLTIIDNEKPTLSFMQNTKTIEEDDSDTNVELTLNLSGPIEEPVDIAYEIIAESAIADTDFVDNGNGVVSIAANTTSIPISIQIKGDDINEGDETFKVRVTTPPRNAVFTETVSMLEATVTITDDESPTLSVDNSTLTISELAEMTHIGLTLSGPTNEDVVITYTTSITESDTAQQADFIAQSASITTISATSTSKTSGLIEIPINNDTDEEEDETFTLTLTGISGAVFANDQSSIVVQVTIIDDEGLPILSIDFTEISVNEQDGYAEIGLSFTPAITEPVTIVYSTIQGTAIGGEDYTIQTNTILEIATGNQEIIFIPITNDNTYEGQEEFSMEISVIQGAAYGSEVINTPILITITDDETEPTITISAYSCEYAEPIPANFSVNESVGNLVFNAKMSHQSKNPVTFNYSATADTATSADFYVSSVTQYTIQPGSVCTEIITPITHDILFEEDEQFEVTFTTDTGTNIIPAFKVKIEDDDVAIWNIEDLAMNEGDSNKEMAFRVYLSTPVYETVRVKWTASTIAGNTATFGQDYAPSHNSYTGYVTVLSGRIKGSIDGLEITGDTIFEPDETFTITLSDPEEGTQIGDGVAIGTIINDDPEPTLSVSTINQVNEN